MRYSVFVSTICVALLCTVTMGARRRTPRTPPPTTPTQPTPPATTAKLIFSQEFNDMSAVAKTSNMTTSWPLGQGVDSAATDGEVEIYVDTQNGATWGPNPFSVNAGILSITATPTPGLPAPRTYTSGLLCTAGKFSFTYGYVEARCKIPGGSGFWPLIWMMKDPGTKSLTWPPEIDILQCSSRIPTETFNAVLWGNSAAPQEFGDFCSIGANLAADFHTYGFEWTATNLNWFIDGKLVLSRATPNGVNVPMFLMVNLAVGDNGTWIGKPDGSKQSFSIDYLRVYDKKP